MADERADVDEATALAALHQRLDEIAAMPGGEAKTQAIRNLINCLEKLWNQATEIRTAEMFRIYDEEKLSLAPLADRVGMSKARAGQKIKERRDRDRREGEPDAGTDDSSR